MRLRQNIRIKLGSDDTIDCSPYGNSPMVLTDSGFSFNMTYSQLGGYIFSPAYDSEKPREMTGSMICKGKSDQDGYALFKDILNRIMIYQQAGETISIYNDASGRACKVYIEGYSNLKLIGRYDCSVTLKFRQLSPWAGSSAVRSPSKVLPLVFTEVDISGLDFGDYPSFFAPCVYFNQPGTVVYFGTSETSNIEDVTTVMAINNCPIPDSDYEYGVRVVPGEGAILVRSSKAGVLPIVLEQKIKGDGTQYLNPVYKLLVPITRKTHLWVKTGASSDIGDVLIGVTKYYMEG